MEMKKYEFTGLILPLKEADFKEIRALEDFGDVKKGDIGGLIESEYNLSHKGTCWIYPDGRVWANGRVEDQALLEYGTVCDSAMLCGDAIIRGGAEISGNAIIEDDLIIDGGKITS
jgi:hypothetical protein